MNIILFTPLSRRFNTRSSMDLMKLFVEQTEFELGASRFLVHVGNHLITVTTKMINVVQSQQNHFFSFCLCINKNSCTNSEKLLSGVNFKYNMFSSSVSAVKFLFTCLYMQTQSYTIVFLVYMGGGISSSPKRGTLDRKKLTQSRTSFAFNQ